MKSLLFVLLLLISLSSCAQTKHIIKNGYSFVVVTNAGTMAVDANGKELTKRTDTLHNIYVETAGDITPEWTALWIDGKAYDVNAMPMEKGAEPGTSRADNRRITITPVEGNKLWLLHASTLIQNKKAPAFNNAGAIIIEGKVSNKKFTYTIEKETVLKPFLRQ